MATDHPPRLSLSAVASPIQALPDVTTAIPYMEGPVAVPTDRVPTMMPFRNKAASKPNPTTTMVRRHEHSIGPAGVHSVPDFALL